MPPHNRADNAASWTPQELFAILLRQFKRLMAERGVKITEAEVLTLSDAMAQRQTHPHSAEVIQVMRQIVDESVQVLAAWNLTYAQSLAASMDDMPGWATTADFLSLANEKGNAELRISAGASLLAGLGDGRTAPYLLAAYANGADDSEDVDAVIARRALCFVADINEADPDWLHKAHAWIAQQPEST